MNTHLVWLAAALALALGCTPPPAPGCVALSPVSGLPAGYLFGASDLADVRLQVHQSFVGDCTSPSVSAVAKVLDPNQDVVASDVTITITEHDGQRMVFAEVTFKPLGPGWYDVDVSFEPNLGRVQTKALVAHDRSAEPSVLFPRKCLAVHRTARGGWLCDSDFFRDGQQVSSLSSAQFVVTAGNVVWAVTPSGVQRLVDPGAGPLVAEPAELLPLIEFHTSYAYATASEQELIIDGGAGLEFYAWDGATWHRQASDLMTAAFPVAFAAFIGGERLLFAPRSDSELTGSSTNPVDVTDVCTVLTEGSVRRGPCVTLRGTVIGAADDALWLYDPQPRLTAVRWSEGKPGATTFLPLPWGWEVQGLLNYPTDPVPGEPRAPRVVLGNLVARLDDTHGIVLDSFDADSASVMVSANAVGVIRTLGTETRAFAR